MGTKGIAIVQVDVNDLLKKLNQAYADEWLAYYQYWIGAKVAKGLGRESVVAELTQHATEELTHADLLANRIIQLGGTPLLEPKEWYSETNCGYDAPKDPFVKTLLEQNIKGEQCAIEVYTQLMNFTADGKDPVTHDIAFRILADEVEHEEDLQGLLEDLSLSLKA